MLYENTKKDALRILTSNHFSTLKTRATESLAFARERASKAEALSASAFIARPLAPFSPNDAH